jgi:hypothetical protein
LACGGRKGNMPIELAQLVLRHEPAGLIDCLQRVMLVCGVVTCGEDAFSGVGLSKWNLQGLDKRRAGEGPR